MLACDTTPISARATRPALIARPATRHSPALGASSPANRRKSVVLPAPLGPNSARHSPAPIEKLTPSTARRPAKVRTSPLAATIGVESIVRCSVRVGPCIGQRYIPVRRGRAILSSRTSEASVGIFYPRSMPGLKHHTLDPDTRSLRSLLRDDRRPPVELRSLL